MRALLIFFFAIFLSACEDTGCKSFNGDSLNNGAVTIPSMSQELYDSGVNVTEGNLFRTKIYDRGLYQKPEKYRVILRVDPRFNNISSYLYQYNNDDGNFWPVFSGTAGNDVISQLKFLKKNSNTCNIKVSQGDVISIRILPPEEFFDEKLAKILNNNPDGSNISDFTFSSGTLDNVIVDSRDKENLCAYNKDICSDNKAFMTSLITGVSKFSGLEKIEDCNNFDLNQLCKFSKGVGLSIFISDTQIKNPRSKFITANNNNLYYINSSSDGFLNFGYLYSTNGVIESTNPEIESLQFADNMLPYFQNKLVEAQRAISESSRSNSSTNNTSANTQNNSSFRIISNTNRIPNINPNTSGNTQTDQNNTTFGNTSNTNQPQNSNSNTSGNTQTDQNNTTFGNTSNTNQSQNSNPNTSGNNSAQSSNTNTTGNTSTIDPIKIIEQNFMNEVVASKFEFGRFASGRYLLEIEVGSGTGQIFQDKVSNLDKYYYIKQGKEIVYNSKITGNELEINAPKGGRVFYQVMNLDKEIAGNVVFTAQSYTKSANFSNFLNENILQPLKEQMRFLSKLMYGNIATNPDFVNLLRALLTLYLVFFGFAFALGSVEITVKELTSRIMKLVVVSMLFSDRSWEFFNTYLFGLFLDSTDQLMKSVSGATAVAGNPFGFIDPILSKYLDADLWFIIFNYVAFFFWGYILPAIILALGIYYFMFSLLQVILGFLMAYLSLCVMIALAPLFITCILFEKTRSIFDNWINVMFGYVIQPTLSLVFLLLIDQIASPILQRGIIPVCYSCLWEWRFIMYEFGIDIPLFCIYGYEPTPSASNITNLLKISILFYGLMKLMKNVVSMSTSMADMLTGGGGSGAGAASGGATGEMATGLVRTMQYPVSYGYRKITKQVSSVNKKITQMLQNRNAKNREEIKKSVEDSVRRSNATSATKANEDKKLMEKEEREKNELNLKEKQKLEKEQQEQSLKKNEKIKKKGNDKQKSKKKKEKSNLGHREEDEN